MTTLQPRFVRSGETVISLRSRPGLRTQDESDIVAQLRIAADSLEPADIAAISAILGKYADGARPSDDDDDFDDDDDGGNGDDSLEAQTLDARAKSCDIAAGIERIASLNRRHREFWSKGLS